MYAPEICNDVWTDGQVCQLTTADSPLAEACELEFLVRCFDNSEETKYPT